MERTYSYVITMQVCYIDMIDEQGYDEEGVPYFYDLYLDLVVYPNGIVIEDDMDELQEALQKAILHSSNMSRHF